MQGPLARARGLLFARVFAAWPALRAAWWLCQPLEQITIPRKALCVVCVCVGGACVAQGVFGAEFASERVCVCGKLCMLRALEKT